ncbi:MAG TPA: hypothetical protein VF596_13040 [Pyrinomonadaceae bacterium]|jgi:hypothetical protein
MSADTSFSFTGMLAWLDEDSDKAAGKYVQFQNEMIAYARQNGGENVADDAVDKAFDRIGEKLTTALLSEHHNSRDIRDISGLCKQIYDEGTKNQSSPSRRIWQLLPSAARLVVTAVAKTGECSGSLRVSLSQALNEMLRRGDFYNAKDFNLSYFPAMSSRNSPDEIIEKIENDLSRGLSGLRQTEIEQFNRRLLEAAFPSKITRNLFDTPDNEKLARCKRYVRLVLSERIKKLQAEVPFGYSSDDREIELQIADTEGKDPLELLIGKEEARREELRLKCAEKCSREALSPLHSVIFIKYFGGVEVNEDETTGENKKIKDIRRNLSEELGVPYATIRIWMHRARKILHDCIEKCMKRQEKVETNSALSS